MSVDKVSIKKNDLFSLLGTSSSGDNRALKRDASFATLTCSSNIDYIYTNLNYLERNIEPEIKEKIYIVISIKEGE